MLKCKICGTEFPTVKERHYVSRENDVVGGLSQSLNGKEEKKTYDCFDWVQISKKQHRHCGSCC